MHAVCSRTLGSAHAALGLSVQLLCHIMLERTQGIACPPIWLLSRLSRGMGAIPML